MKTLLALPFIALSLVALSATTPALFMIATTPAMAANTGLGDLTMFKKIASDTLMLLEKG